ncbi:efflux RND transporter permease subunit [Pseudoalteromonas rubra]|uniref:efflux RND transporter permease subunit n=1 Tax=Pseudoalteromonas rubra TaxID=43658 RepID=UPI000F7B27D6|nr:efflux RND transporter permease subunit [Pseudoalteromonas rubra]
MSTPWFVTPRLILGLVCILCLTGIGGWFSAPEQEDPSFPYRNGLIVLNASGLEAQSLAQRYVRPLERVLAQIDEIQNYSAQVQHGVASLDIELKETVYNTDEVWQRIKEGVAPIRQSNPSLSITILDRVQDTQGIFLSVGSRGDLLQERQLAIALRDQLLALSTVRNAQLVGDPGQQLGVAFAQQSMLQTGITPLQIAQRIAQANNIESVASVTKDRANLNLSPVAQLDSVAELKNTLIATAQGQQLPLATLADIHYRTDPQARESFWVNGRQQVGVAVTLVPNRIRIAQAGEQVIQLVERFNHTHGADAVRVELFQPKWAKKRKDALMQSLMLSLVAIAVILFVFLSASGAASVCIAVVVITLTAVAAFSAMDGVLHQMTIAGLILSLGLMVDNCIVVAERFNRHVLSGAAPLQSAIDSITELWRPLCAATVTTVAAFLPMLMAKGSVADFIASIPVMVILCIVASYAIALTLVPLLNRYFPERKSQASRWQQQLKLKLEQGALALSQFTLQHKALTLVAAFGLCVGLMSLPQAEGEFFPKTNRNQAIVDVELPMGSHKLLTASTLNRIAEDINAHANIERTLVFSGFSGPRFYYNLAQKPDESHIGRVVLSAQANTDMSQLVKQLNTRLQEDYLEAVLRARELGQGPPLESTVVMWLSGEDYSVLRQAGEEVFAVLNADPRFDKPGKAYSSAVPQLMMAFDQQRISQFGLTERQLNDYLAWRSAGLTMTHVSFNNEPTSVVLYDPDSSHDSIDMMNTGVLTPLLDKAVPVHALADPQIIGKQAVLARRNGVPVVKLISEVAPGVDEAELLTELTPVLTDIAERHGLELELGGEMAESDEANSALFKTLPLGALLLFIALILQFNSLRLTLLVMLSIPFAIIGAPAMLSLVQVPFGFMSVLGILSLAGIVVNNAILLIDGTLLYVRAGQNTQAAIVLSVQNRVRPVIVTSVTTIVGMLPLTSASSPLWPPLAWAVIGGLLTSTILVLVVIPVLLSVLLPRRNKGLPEYKPSLGNTCTE